MPDSSKTSQEAKGERINFRASERLVGLLTQLKSKHGITMSESIRRGVALFAIAKEELDKGRTLAFVDQDGKVAVEVHSI